MRDSGTVSTALGGRQIAGTKTPRSPVMHARTGIFGALTGTVLAVLALPEGADSADLVMPALLLTLGLALAPALASFEDAKAILRMEYLLVIGVVYWLLLDLLQGAGNVEGVAHHAVEESFIAIGLFAIGIYAASAMGALRLPRAVRQSAVSAVSPRAIFALTVICFLLGVFPFAYATGFDPLAMLYYAGVGRWAAPWSTGKLGGWMQVISHFQYFGYLVPALAVTLAVRVGWGRAVSVVAVVLGVLLMLLLAQGGGRRIIGVMAGAALLVWILAQSRIDLRRVVVIAIAVTAILATMEVMLQFRNVGLKVFAGEWEQSLETERIHVDDNFLRLAQTIEIIPEKHDYVYEQQILYALLRPIPRALWPGKPESPGFSLSDSIGMPWVALSASTIAEWYVSGGLLVVFIGGVIYGLLARAGSVMWRVTDRPAGRLVYAIYAMALFAGLRSMIDLVLMSYMLLGWMFCWWLFVGRFERRARVPEAGAAL